MYALPETPFKERRLGFKLNSFSFLNNVKLESSVTPAFVTQFKDVRPNMEAFTHIAGYRVAAVWQQLNSPFSVTQMPATNVKK